MEVVKDINFTNDLEIGASTERYSLDLYLPIGSYLDVNRAHREDLTLEGNFEGPETWKTIIVDNVSNRSVASTADNNGSKFGHRDINNNNNNKIPFVIFIHGGGWRRGDRDAWRHYMHYDVNFLVSMMTWLFGTYGNVGESFAKNGIPCAVISYPLTELGTPWIFFELLASYIQSCFLVFISIFVPVAVVMLYRMTSDIHMITHWTYMHGRMSVTRWKEKVLFTMLVTNFLTLILLTVKRNQFKLTKINIFSLWVIVVLGSFPLKFSSTSWICQLVMVTFISGQYIILKVRLRRSRRSVTDQVKVVARAMEWVQRQFRRANLDLFLMGHSAGGHLACLTAIEKMKYEGEQCSIKGVISVSGVYDVTCLNTPFIRRFYLYPTFGDKECMWEETSPSHLVRQRRMKCRNLPPFLLISAEKDLFLKRQSWEFYETLQEAEVESSHIEIKGTNHFSIITNFKHAYLDSENSPISDVVNFILKQ